MWTRDNATDQPKAAPAPSVQPVVQPVSPPLPAEERRVVAWVGKSVRFQGTLTSSEDMTIDGHIEGTIDIQENALTIGPDADIKADIVASTITIHGTVTGNVRAKGKVDIKSTGRVEGNLFTPRLVMADGAVVRGRVDTSNDQADAKKRTKLAIA
ncbi:MAG TPA: polymer-forming cytoskeletal protein [Vicinamibacterales bacterium]|jgi:cytoskeletal protein CcmA (bactofilin family)|nr:polymer-forming cytoskeletal protein [Vicinamibacterales bacterium]